MGATILEDAAQEVHGYTRAWLASCEAQGIVDVRSKRAVVAALEPNLGNTPAILVLLLARALEAPEEPALRAACFAELFFASTSLVDDVQDGDAELDDLTTALQMYALALRICAPGIRDLVTECTSMMAEGQRLEMARESWDIDMYARVALATSGAEFRALLAAAAHASGLDPTPWQPVGDVLGQILHLDWDQKGEDSRVTVLPHSEVKAYSRRLLDELRVVLDEVPRAARPYLRRAAGYAC